MAMSSGTHVQREEGKTEEEARQQKLQPPTICTQLEAVM